MPVAILPLSLGKDAEDSLEIERQGEVELCLRGEVSTYLVNRERSTQRYDDEADCLFLTPAHGHWPFVAMVADVARPEGENRLN